MFQLLLIIISYGALLLLLMPPTGIGIISSALIFLFGAGLMIFVKPNIVNLIKRKSYFLTFILISILIAASLGVDFYHRWLASSKIKAIASMLHLSNETILLTGTFVLAICSLIFIYTIIQILFKKPCEIIHTLIKKTCTIIRIFIKKVTSAINKNPFARDLVFCLIAATVTVMLAQIMIDMEVLSMGYVKFFVGVLIVSVLILFLYSLLKKITTAILLGAGIFMVIATVNVYVYNFRSRLFEPLDLLSAGTAMNVAGNYNLFPVPDKILISWRIFIAILIVFACLQRGSKSNIHAKKRIVLLAVCFVCSIGLVLYTSNLKTYHWYTEGALFNGYILDFVSKFKEMSVPKPDNYSVDLITDLAAKYSTDGNGQESKPADPPHIFVIMNEAFSDLHVIGEFSTNTEITPFISSLKNNTVSGYVLASVYGGNTANSEYEFLTGNSLAWLSPNAVPYQQYVRKPTYSMVSYLKSFLNYKAIAMHPFQANGWGRPPAYEFLGFDECYFIEDFPKMNYVRNFVSDQEMFEFLIETYETQKEEPLFIFGVTMQNHGEYTYSGENFTKYISLDDYGDQFPDVEQYLSLIHETDKAVEYLITYFQDNDDDVVIVFFGDHQPKINASFYETISGTTATTLDEQQKLYKVPFFIWANYDIDEEYVNCTSLNYLSSYMYDAAGIPLPLYNRFLTEMEGRIPSINVNGYYSRDEGRYLNFDEANEEERLWLEVYEALQYNNIFDKAHQNEALFPLLKQN